MRKFEQMALAVKRKDTMLKRMREEGVGMNMQELFDSLGSGNQTDALKKILKANKSANTRLREQEMVAEKAKRQAAMLIKRDAYNKQLQDNWKTQLKQMEQAILLCSTIHKRDRTSFGEQIRAKDEQIEKLKAYVSTFTQLRQPKPKTFMGAGGRISVPKTIGRRNKAKPALRKKRRPSKSVKSGEAGEAIQA